MLCLRFEQGRLVRNENSMLNIEFLSSDLASIGKLKQVDAVGKVAYVNFFYNGSGFFFPEQLSVEVKYAHSYLNVCFILNHTAQVDVCFCAAGVGVKQGCVEEFILCINGFAA